MAELIEYACVNCEAIDTDCVTIDAIDALCIIAEFNEIISFIVCFQPQLILLFRNLSGGFVLWRSLIE